MALQRGIMPFLKRYSNKITEEVNCSLEVALSWALSAMNSLQDHYGCSLNQPVFECNPNIQTVLKSDLPSLEGLTSSQLANS